MRGPVVEVRGFLLSIGDEPETTKTGLRYTRPISVHHQGFIIYSSPFTLHGSFRPDDTVIETDQALAASLRLVRHSGDFRAWRDHDPYQKPFERLLRDL